MLSLRNISAAAATTHTSFDYYQNPDTIGEHEAIGSFSPVELV